MNQSRGEDQSRRQFMGGGGCANEFFWRAGNGSVIHRPDRISGERQHGVQFRRPFGVARFVEVTFRAENSLRREKIWPCSLPAARQCAAVQVHDQLSRGRIFKQGVDGCDGFLTIRTPEIHLHSANTGSNHLIQYLSAAFRIIKIPRMQPRHRSHGFVLRMAGNVVQARRPPLSVE